MCNKRSIVSPQHETAWNRLVRCRAESLQQKAAKSALWKSALAKLEVADVSKEKTTTTYKVMIVLLDGSRYLALETTTKEDARKALEGYREYEYEAWVETE